MYNIYIYNNYKHQIKNPALPACISLLIKLLGVMLSYEASKKLKEEMYLQLCFSMKCQNRDVKFSSPYLIVIFHIML